MTPLGEPLLTDGRLEKIERQIRQEFPRLQEQSNFVSWVQEPFWTNIGGIDIQVPRTAVLAILVTNPRHPDSIRIFQTGEILERWRQRNWSTRHDSNVKVDPAYHALKRLVPEIIDWTENLKAMLN